jgi:hypothetical protein
VAHPHYLSEAFGITAAGSLPCFVAAQIAVRSFADISSQLAAADIIFRQIRLREGDAIAATLPSTLGGTMLIHAG